MYLYVFLYPSLTQNAIGRNANDSTSVAFKK